LVNGSTISVEPEVYDLVISDAAIKDMRYNSETHTTKALINKLVLTEKLRIVIL
jgi:hypothetical protein